MVKKYLLPTGLAAFMLLAASQALAVAYEPGTDVEAATANAQASSKLITMPCLSEAQSLEAGNYSYPPCGKVIYKHSPADMHFKGALGMWFGLMFIITVAMVWVVLLLLIALLWKLVKKHRHS
jgi:hypothetical protein